MTSMDRCTFRLTDRHHAMLDDAVSRGVVPNRSEAVRAAIVDAWDVPPDYDEGSR